MEDITSLLPVALLLIFFAFMVLVYTGQLQYILDRPKKCRHKFREFIIKHEPPEEHPEIRLRPSNGDTVTRVLNAYSTNTYEIRCEKCGCKAE